MNSSDRGRWLLGRGRLLALVALAVASCAQVAVAEAAIIGPDGKVYGPNTIRHAAPGSGNADQLVAPSGPVVPGSTIIVTTTDDGGPGSLRQTIAEAPSGTTIVVPPGTYVLTQGELKIEKPLTIAGAGADRTTIDGNENFRAFLIQFERETLKTEVTISGLTITNASATVPVPGLGSNDGAAIASLNASLTLENDVITRNVAKSREGFVFGGALHVNFGPSFTMIGTTVSENLATGSGGEFGAFILGGAVSIEGTDSTIVEDSEIVANVATGSGFSILVGGAGRIVGNGPVRVSGSVIKGNVAEADSGEVIGGGLHVIGEPATLVGNQIRSNVADAGSGRARAGGLNFSGIGEIDGSLIEGNEVRGAESLGGNLVAEPGFLLEEHDLAISRTSILRGIGPAGSENCATFLEATIRSLGFNRESTDQCGFDAEGDEVNVG